jgi:hypothetical protein
MSLIIGRGNKSFIWNNSLEVEYSGSIMEDCQIKLNNTFTKILPKREIAVFGDYTIYILYSSPKKETKTKYYTKSIGTTVYDIIPYKIVKHGHKPADRADIKVNVEFLFQPSCRYNFYTTQKGGFIYAYWKIQHHGEININLSIDEGSERQDDAENPENDDTSAKIDSVDDNTASEQNTGTKVWRINQSLNIPAADLLEMDLNQLDTVSEADHPITTIHE